MRDDGVDDRMEQERPVPYCGCGNLDGSCEHETGTGRCNATDCPILRYDRMIQERQRAILEREGRLPNGA